MLQTIHEHVKGWIAGIIIALISASFIFWGVQYYAHSEKNGSQTVAEVNGKKITENQLQSTVRQLEHQYTARTDLAPTEEQIQEMKKRALENLILKSALLQAAKEAGFRTSAKQVDKLIVSLPDFQVNGQFSEQRYRQLLYANSLTPAEFFQQTSNALLINQVQSGIEDSAFVLPNEIKASFNLMYQKRNFEYLVVPSSRLLKSVKITPEAIEKYYQKNKAKFKTPEKVSIDYIILSPKEISKKVTVTDEQVKRDYQNNIGNYRVPRRWKIQRIFLPIPNKATPAQAKIAKAKAQALEQKLKKGVQFATLMKQEDGIAQWVNEVEISSKLSQYLSTMKPGQISPAFRTNKGMNIVRLVAAKPSKTKPFNKVKGQIKNRLIQQKTSTILSKQANLLSDITYTNPTSLKPAAKALKLKVHTTGFFSKQGGKTGIVANPNVIAAAFSADVLQDGNNSNPITLKDGSLLVLRVKQHQQSYIPPLEKVFAKIKQHMAKELSRAKAHDLAKKIQTALVKNENSQSLISAYHLKWNKRTGVLRTNKSIPSAILLAAFNLSLKNDQIVTTVAMPNGDAAVVKLNSIKMAQNKITSSEHEVLEKKLLTYFGQLDYQLYTQSVKNNAEIEFNKK